MEMRIFETLIHRLEMSANANPTNEKDFKKTQDESLDLLSNFVVGVPATYASMRQLTHLKLRVKQVYHSMQLKKKKTTMYGALLAA